MKIVTFFHNLSLGRKILIIVIIASIIPLTISSLVSFNNLKNNEVENQIYAINSGYDQIILTLSESLNTMTNISTLISVNESINDTLSMEKENEGGSVVEQLEELQGVSAYSYTLELGLNDSNILYYINTSIGVSNAGNSRFRSIESIEDEDWVLQLRNRRGKPTWVKFDEINQYGRTSEFVAITRIIWDKDDFDKELGILAIVVETQNVENLIIPSQENQILMLETTDGDRILDNLPNTDDPIPIDYIQYTNGSFVYTEGVDGDYLFRRNLIENTNLVLTSYVPIKSIEAIKNNIRKDIITTYLVTIFILALIDIPLSRTVTRRVTLLSEKMDQVAEGEIKALDIEPQYDEVGRLIISYNQMVKRVEESLTQQYLLGQEKKEAELKALQSQINPHFLYNTLDMLNWMAQKNESHNIQEVIHAMSRFYKLTLSRGADIITLGDEILLCKAFSEIQTKRFRGKIQFDFSVPKELMTSTIPKITLQPLVENAIIHGINEKESARGKITVSGWVEEEGRMILAVVDDGVGIPTTIESLTTKGSRYGIVNIEKRLSIYYGEEIQLKIESTAGIGTCVSMDVPIVQ